MISIALEVNNWWVTTDCIGLTVKVDSVINPQGVNFLRSKSKTGEWVWRLQYGEDVDQDWHDILDTLVRTETPIQSLLYLYGYADPRETADPRNAVEQLDRILDT